MTTQLWKVWFYIGFVKFGMDFKGEYGDVCDAAKTVAERLGVGFDYEVSEGNVVEKTK